LVLRDLPYGLGLVVAAVLALLTAFPYFRNAYFRAIVLGIAGGLGGRGTGSTVASILLGIVALSYPVLEGLHVVEQYVPNPVGGFLR